MSTCIFRESFLALLGMFLKKKKKNLWHVFHSKEGTMCAKRKGSSQINVHVTRDTGGTRAHGKHEVLCQMLHSS